MWLYCDTHMCDIRICDLLFRGGWGEHTEKYRKQVSLWLLSMWSRLCDGDRRRTYSTDTIRTVNGKWRPIMILPPIGETGWIEVLKNIKTLRNKKVNYGIRFVEFKNILV